MAAHPAAYDARMSRSLLRVVFAVWWLVVVLAVPPAWAQSPAETAAVKALVARYVDARERRDPQALSAVFAADADQLVSSGEWRRGRDAVVQGGLASSARNSGARSITVETVRLLSSDVAIADGRYDIAAAEGQPARRMWTTFLLVRTAEGWRISAIRNMRPTA